MVEDDAQNDGNQDDENDVNNVIEDLPDYILLRVERLKELDEEREKFMVEYQNERAALELKYQSLCKPLYTKRAEVVRGDKDEEIEKAAGKSGGDDGDQERAKGIPQFWVCAMGHMEVVGSLIAEEDVECLEYLKEINCDDREDGKGFTLKFTFDSNPYFENTVLTKQYDVPNLLLGDEPILKNVVGCTIDWKPEKCLTYKVVKKKQRGKGKHAGQVRTVTKKERKDSFFHWFDPPKMPAMEEMDEEEVDKLEELFDHDYDVAQSFRTHIIPKAVLWFTGQAAEQELDEAVAELNPANN